MRTTQTENNILLSKASIRDKFLPLQLNLIRQPMDEKIPIFDDHEDTTYRSAEESYVKTIQGDAGGYRLSSTNGNIS